MVYTLEHGTVVIVCVCSETLTTVNCHDLTRAEAGIIGGQEQDGVSDLLRIVELAHERDLGSCLIEVGLVFLLCQLHSDKVLVVGAGL